MQKCTVDGVTFKKYIIFLKLYFCNEQTVKLSTSRISVYPDGLVVFRKQRDMRQRDFFCIELRVN